MGPLSNRTQVQKALPQVSTMPKSGQADKPATVVHTKSNWTDRGLIQHLSTQGKQLAVAEHRAADIINKISVPKCHIKAPGNHSPAPIPYNGLPPLPSLPTMASAPAASSQTKAAGPAASGISRLNQTRIDLGKEFLQELKPANVDPVKWKKIETCVEHYFMDTRAIQGDKLEALLTHVIKNAEAKTFMASFSSASQLS